MYQLRCTDCGRTHSALGTSSYVRFGGVTRSVIEPGEQLCAPCVALRHAPMLRKLDSARARIAAVRS